MKNNLIRKGLVFGIIVLFVGAGIMPSTGYGVNEKSINPISNGNTLYVGGIGEGNYTKIQDAIDDASDGDTVFVFDDSSPYPELLCIDKSINLIGENRNTTVICYERIPLHLVYVNARWVNISGFTIIGDCSSWYGILLRYSEHSTITGNIISYHEYGISIYGDGNTITDNILTNNDVGISSIYGDSNTIMDNTITGVSFPCDTDSGIWLQSSRLNIIKGNNIKSFGFGINLDSSSLNIITSNTISENIIGIKLEYYARGNIILKNNIIDNEKNAYFTTHLDFRTNRWMQNYWNEPMISPKIIFGERIFIIPIGLKFPFYTEKWIPWFPQFDWHPAKEPYDI